MQRYTIYIWERGQAMLGAREMKDASTPLPALGSGGQGGWGSRGSGAHPGPATWEVTGEPPGCPHGIWVISASSLLLQRDNDRAKCSPEPRGWAASYICRIPPCTLNTTEQTALSTRLLGMPPPPHSPASPEEELQKLGSASLILLHHRSWSLLRFRNS